MGAFVRGSGGKTITPANDFPWKLCRVSLLTALLFGAGINEFLDSHRVVWFRGLHTIAMASTYAHLVAGVFQSSRPNWPRSPVRFERATDARLFIAQMHLVEGYVIFLAAWLLYYILPKPLDQAEDIRAMSDKFFQTILGSLVHGLLFLEAWWGSSFSTRRHRMPVFDVNVEKQRPRREELLLPPPPDSDWAALKEFAKTWEFAAAISAVAVATLFFALVFTSVISYKWLEHFLILMIVITLGIDGYLAFTCGESYYATGELLSGQRAKIYKIHDKNK